MPTPNQPKLGDRPEPTDLLELRPAEGRDALVALATDLGSRAFRGRQAAHQVWSRHARSFDGMPELPADLRRAFAARVRIGLLTPSHRVASVDGTVKYLWRLPDDREIESVAIPTDRRLSFCVSSQVGCALRCRFCATASLGLGRNLTRGEIVDQVLAMLADRGPEAPAPSVVFMGMGEPGYNLDAVLDACRTLNDPAGLGIGARHLTISTAGVVPAIRTLTAEPLQVRLAVSLHAGRQELREELMNVAARHPLPELAEACQAYHHATRRRITFEYIVIPGVNDDAKAALELGAFAGPIPSKINLIPYNPVTGFEAPPCSEAEAARFRDRLAGCYRGEVVVRRTRGRDIEAACGMLHRARAASPPRPAAASRP